MAELGLAVVMVTAMGAIALIWGRSRPYELWARCDGEQVLLYSHNDPVKFHKVQQALSRAMNGQIPRESSRGVAYPDPGVGAL
jgi:Family of unknown function (DUF6232)